jgi:hypothetical protein
MSNTRFWMPVAALCLGMTFAGSLDAAHAQQAGATDPSLFNTGGPGQTNDTRPTLVLPDRAPEAAAARPGDAAVNSGWSSAGGPYTDGRGHAVSSRDGTDGATTARLAQR